MAPDTKVTIYYGPLSWFHKQLGNQKRESLLELAYARDEQGRQFKIVDGREDAVLDDQNKPQRPSRVAAESSDYASLSEHVISNFAGLIRLIHPKHLHLHNPPAQVQAQIQRAMPATSIQRFEYPLFTHETLAEVHHGFADHLVGQHKVKKRLLAALYPLTRPGRMKPVVLMFYGPSGVGKTETAQFVNSLLGGALLRKQFSMFHSEKFASYLFGGKHSEPSLAHDLLDRESGVILIDEFDKANPVFHSAFYELFDGGVFEDKNYNVRLGPSLIICTSNYGSDKEVQETLGEALYSRFDAVIRFERLSSDEIIQVIDRLVDDRFRKLTDDERQYLNLEDVKHKLYPLAKDSGNVRKLGKTVDELIALLLVQSAFPDDLLAAADRAPGAHVAPENGNA